MHWNYINCKRILLWRKKKERKKRVLSARETLINLDLDVKHQFFL